MHKQAPTFGRMLVMSVFTLSCGGLLLFLWLAFGGVLPFASKGYRVTIPFPEAGQLALESDVRISGVTVGKVRQIDLDRRRGVTDAVVEIDAAHAPLSEDARAILRQKSLLGETYVELTPGTPGGPRLAEGARLAPGQIGSSVELDEIFRALDPRTRKDFQRWMTGQSVAIDGRGRDISDALGNLAPVAEDSTDLLRVLSAQEGAVRRLVLNTGVVSGALGEREGQLASLVRGANRVFATTARRDAQLEAVFRILPSFEAESALALRRLTAFALDADPLVTQLRPAARELSPTLRAGRRIAPELRALFEGLGPLIDASRAGLPALSAVLREARPLLGQLDPWLRQVNPALRLVGLYRAEFNAFWANSVAATQAVSAPDGTDEIRLHYLRGGTVTNPGALAFFPRRIGSDRANPYPGPGISLADGYRVFEDRNCGRGDPSIAPATALPPELQSLLADDLRALIDRFVYGGADATAVPAPPCTSQPAFPAVGTTCAGLSGAYRPTCPDARPPARR